MGQVERSIIFAGSACILAEGYVKRPMEIVLNAPMSTARVQYPFGLGRQGCNIKTHFAGHMTRFFIGAFAGDGRDRAQAFPLRMSFFQPGNIIDNAAGAFFNTTMSSVKSTRHKTVFCNIRVVKKSRTSS